MTKHGKSTQTEEAKVSVDCHGVSTTEKSPKSNKLLASFFLPFFLLFFVLPFFFNKRIFSIRFQLISFSIFSSSFHVRCGAHPPNRENPGANAAPKLRSAGVGTTRTLSPLTPCGLRLAHSIYTLGVVRGRMLWLRPRRHPELHPAAWAVSHPETDGGCHIAMTNTRFGEPAKKIPRQGPQNQKEETEKKQVREKRTK